MCVCVCVCVCVCACVCVCVRVCMPSLQQVCLRLLSVMPMSTEAALRRQGGEGVAAVRTHTSGDGLVDALDRLAQLLDPLLSDAATARRTRGTEEEAMGRTRSADVYMYHQPQAGGAGGPLVLL